MAALAPPRPSRSRTLSVSTSVRPPLSISTLSRSPATTYSTQVARTAEDASEHSTSPTDSRVPSPTDSSPPPSPAFVLPPFPAIKRQPTSTRSSYQNMFPVLVSRTIDLWRAVRPGASGKHSQNFFNSPHSSPRSSMESEYILPLSASPQKSSFDVAELDDASAQYGAHSRLHPFPSVHASLLFVIILFPLSTAVALFCMSTLPITFAWPRTLSDLTQLGQDLNRYSQSGFLQTAHIVGVLAVSAVWKHAWSVPGSVLWNVLAGALFHPLLATLLMTVLTSLGSIFATLLATPLAPILTRFFPRPVELTRAALEGSSSSSATVSVQSGETKAIGVMTTSKSSNSPAWARLSVLRLVGVVPWSALNIACGLTGVALRDCFAGAFIGVLPWTAVTCQIGDILQIVGKASTGTEEALSPTATLGSVLAQPSMIFELVFLTVLSLAPILGRDYLRRLISSSEDKSEAIIKIESEKEEPVRSSMKEYEETDFDDDFGRRGRRVRRQRWTWQRLSMSVPRWNALHSPLRSSFPKIERDGDVHQ